MDGRQRRSLRTTTSSKRSISQHRVAARSDRWPRNLACAIPCCGAGWNCVGLGGSRRRLRGARRRRGTVETVEQLNLSEFWDDRLDSRIRVEVAAIHQDHRGG
jgi:hypothetical protein